MSNDTKVLRVIPKSFTRDYMWSDGSSIILKDREILVESEGEGDTLTLRFKIGDGVTPYSKLPYVSSMYSLFPNVMFYNKSGTNAIDIRFKDCE